MSRKRRKNRAGNTIIYRTTKYVVIYIRVSTEEQAKDAYGPESQEIKCRELCAQRGWIVVEVFKDLGYSGWKNVKRPGFRAMNEYIRTNKNVNLVFFDYSRIYRRMSPAIEFFEKIDSWGVYSVSACHPNIDCLTAAGHAARRAELNKAEDFSDSLSETQKHRMKAALFSGRWITLAPPGFTNIRAKKGGPNIVPVEPEISFIRKSFLEFRTGAYTRTELFREMTKRGMRRKNGKEYNVDQFVNILRNIAYIKQVPSEEYGPQPGLHQRIVSDEVYRDVQFILDGKKSVTAPYVKNRPSVPLRGFLLCNQCETRLTGGASKGNHGKTYYNYYYCYFCHSVSVRADKADAQFVELLRQLPSGEAVSSKFQGILKDEWEKKVGDEPNIEGRLSRGLSKLLQDMKDLVMAHVRGDPAVEPYFDELKKELEGKISNIQAQISETQETKAKFSEVLDFSRFISVNLANAWEVAEIKETPRVQNTLFPGGFRYDQEKGILNPGNDSVFCQLQIFLLGNMGLVRPEGFEPPAY